LQVLFQKVRFFPSGVGAPTFLYIRNPNKHLPVAMLAASKWTTPSVADVDIQGRWNARPDIGTRVLLAISSRFTVAIGWALT
jgi:hypothetical protein